MLEIYNETIRDLLSPNRSGFDPSRMENAGKQYTIKHDANGNTHVSDLTIVDVCSSREVSYLLERAAQSRYQKCLLIFFPLRVCTEIWFPIHIRTIFSAV